MRFIEHIRRTVNKYGMLSGNDRIVLGVSGGPDSIALLYSLYQLSDEYKLDLHVAHMDHMLRKNSKSDAQFVKKTCSALGIPATIKTVDIKRIRGTGSIEEKARNERLKFLMQVARKHKTRIIALGHNLDDQAETVLMRLLRGSGLYGLAAILPRRIINGYTIIRPLIETNRKTIEAFLKRKKILPRIDESNFADIYLRNRVRRHLLPLLEKRYNSNIKAVLSNTARAAADDYDFLLGSAQRITDSMGKRIHLQELRALHPSMRRLVLRLSFQKLKGNTRTLEYRHIEELEDLLLNRPAGSIVDLPSNISAIRSKTFLYFYIR